MAKGTRSTSSSAILDKNHGFMKYIIKNQIDRDNYDKEQRKKDNVKQNLTLNCEKNYTEQVNNSNRIDFSALQRNHQYDDKEPQSTVEIIHNNVEDLSALNNDSDEKQHFDYYDELDQVPSKLSRLSLTDNRLLFNLEFLTKEGEVVVVPVNEEDSADDVVERVISQYPLSDDKQNLLVQRIKKEIRKLRLHGQ